MMNSVVKTCNEDRNEERQIDIEIGDESENINQTGIQKE